MMRNGLAVRILNPPEMNPLGPSSQTARFLDQFWPPYANFKGSMVLSVESPGTHFRRCRTLHQSGAYSLGLMSVIPVLIGTGQSLIFCVRKLRSANRAASRS